jgi:IPT/TIG domain
MAKKPVVAHKQFSTITYGDVKASPSGWLDATPDSKEVPMTDFETELAALIDTYRNKANKHGISQSLVGAADIIEKDEGWIYDETNVQPVSPTLTSLTPNTAIVGDADLDVTLAGTDFSASSVVLVDGSEEDAEFVSDTQLTLTLSPASAVEGPVSVTVKNGTLESSPLDFTFTAPV